MNIVLKPELEQLIQSELDTGKYENSEQNSRRIIARKVKNLFDKTQAIPDVQEITEDESAVEIESYRRGE